MKKLYVLLLLGLALPLCAGRQGPTSYATAAKRGAAVPDQDSDSGLEDEVGVDERGMVPRVLTFSRSFSKGALRNKKRRQGKATRAAAVNAPECEGKESNDLKWWQPEPQFSELWRQQVWQR